MADAVVALVARLKATTGLTSDIVENVIHTKTDTATFATDLIAAMQAFRDFYIVDSGAGQTRPLSDYLSGSLSRVTNATEILAYMSDDLTGATPMGAPVGSLTFTLTAPATASPYPDEVAAVLSTHADLSGVPVSEANPSPPPAIIRPQQRRRGRLYFGPVNTQAAGVSSGRTRPTISFRQDVCAAADALMTELGSLTDQAWGVWSKADAEVYEIIGGYMDDAWDTQRRRGVDPSTRDTFGT